jgi:PST family polysaccharide transporter
LPYLVLLLTVPLTGLSGVPIAKLERKLDFGRVAGIELGGQFLGLLTAALLAWSGLGVWAPVFGQMTAQIYVLIAAWVSAQMFPRPQFESGQAREMLAFGIGLTASLRTWQLRTLINPLLVGRFAGAEGVAYVALALRIAEALGTIRLAAGRMAIAALSRLQHQRAEFRTTLERAIGLQIITLGPLLCGFALAGPFAVRHVMGARWMPSLAVYPFVAAGVLANSVYNLQASALFVLGRQWTVMWSYMTHVALLSVGTHLLLPRLGIAGYGWAELLACVAYFLIHAGLARVVVISYRRTLPWFAVFLTGLFVLA